MKHVGDKGENFVTSKLSNIGVIVEKNNEHEKRYDYDLICKLGTITFYCEVKFDAMASKTGNIAMETHNSKKDMPSGINITKADLWVIVLLEDTGLQAWAASVKDVKEFMVVAKPFKKIKSGGDKNADLSIYKKEDILKIFSRLDIMTQEEFTRWLIQKTT